MSLPYDQTSPISIEKYGKRLLGKTLRTQAGAVPIPSSVLETRVGSRTRGSFGQMLEKYYYGIEPGNDSAPDFREAGVELKSTPLKRLSKGGFSAKERLVLNLINYKEEAEVDGFKASSFLRKNATIMLVSYENKEERAAVDHPVRIARLLKFTELPKKDQLIIQNDWKTIFNKIKAGKAHELHEGETDYLAACTKAANSTVTRAQAFGGPATKPRAFSFKAGYMTVLMHQLMDPKTAAKEFEPAIKDSAALSRKTFEAEILKKFSPYIGMSAKEIRRQVARGSNETAKDHLAVLARRMMGVKGKRVEEFEKAEITMKTLQLMPDGMPKEDMSFPTIKFVDLVNEDWESPDEGGKKKPSSFRAQLEKRFLFIVFQRDVNGSRRFLKAFFWTMPEKSIETEVKKVWKTMVKAVKAGDVASFPKKSFNPVAHVRPHGANREDTDTLPSGEKTTRRCFWLDKRFIRLQIEAAH